VPEITILTEAELRDHVALDAGIVDVIEQAFASLARDHVVMPPILSMAIEEKHGEVDVKTAYLPGLDGFAVKISPGFFDNPKLGLPSLNGLMLLFSAETGILQAVLLDNGYLTDVRTAAAGAVAARHLAPKKVETAGVIGAGRQAELQMRALKLVRDLKEVQVWARDRGKAEAFVPRLADALGCPVRLADSAEVCVRAAQVVVTTTPSRAPLIAGDWLHPGLHITAMGSDAALKNELAPEVLARADRYVPDRLAQCAALGELHHAIDAGLIAAGAAFPELGQVICGAAPGRRSETEITVCDLTGTGAQDTAIATLARRRCAEAGVGTVITT